MHSGGSLKEKWATIYIEAPIEEAKVIFYNRFGHGPERVTCTCCGDDYSISESETLEEASAYHRNCVWIEPSLKRSGAARYLDGDAKGNGEPMPSGYKHGYTKFGDWVPLDEYVKQDGVLIICDGDIKQSERRGDVPEQGYVWHD
jgi:hypothetical protein